MNEEMIRAEIEEGIKQVDENFVVSSFGCINTERSCEVVFTFTDGETEMEVETKWD